MKNKNISMLLSLYDKEKPEYLQEALTSIFAQTLLPDEIVLVYDGPINKNLEIVVETFEKRYSDKFKLVKLEQNQGLGVALAKGLEHTSNRLVARMDTDDIMVENRLEKQLAIFEQHPEISIVGSNIDEFVDNKEHIIGKRIVPEYNHEICQFSKKRNPFNHMTVMFDKNAILSVGNYQPLIGFEDYYLWVRLLKAGFQGYNVQEPLVYARAGADMYARRGGIKYLMPGLKGRYHIWKAGLGTAKDFLFVSCAHSLVCLLPNNLRGKIYQSQLRK